jgi:hypothetical protein
MSRMREPLEAAGDELVADLPEAGRLVGDEDAGVVGFAVGPDEDKW